jgi:dihydroflavonol-4-reductase
MPLALVTGATGLVGANLALALAERGWRVRALRRTTSPTAALEDIPHETAIGDVLDPDSLRAAMQGCDVVFHVAGVSDHWRAGKDLMYRVNVEGVRLVAEAAVAARVERLVLTSSVAALGIPPHGRLLTEEDSFNVPPARFPYGHSKFLGEEELRKAIKEKGLDGVIVNPAAVLGPRDVHLGSASLILEMKRLSLPFLPDGGMNLVDAYDTALGHIAAAERGRTGERYIIGGHNISHIALSRIVGAALGKKMPLRLAPPGLRPCGGCHQTGPSPYRAADRRDHAARHRDFLRQHRQSGSGVRPAAYAGRGDGEENGGVVAGERIFIGRPLIL